MRNSVERKFLLKNVREIMYTLSKHFSSSVGYTVFSHRAQVLFILKEFVTHKHCLNFNTGISQSNTSFHYSQTKFGIHFYRKTLTSTIFVASPESACQKMTNGGGWCCSTSLFFYYRNFYHHIIKILPLLHT